MFTFTSLTAGTTLAQLSPNGDATEILAALQQAANGHATTTRHQLVAATGIVDVVTREPCIVSVESRRR
jgi:hypothetical protein